MALVWTEPSQDACHRAALYEPPMIPDQASFAAISRPALGRGGLFMLGPNRPNVRHAMADVVAAQLAKLQTALLDGRISQAMYEQLKSDLLAAISRLAEPVETQLLAWTCHGEGQPLTLEPCSPEHYSPEWEWIKSRLIQHGCSYMIDTPEKMSAQAKSFGFLYGLGAGTLGWRVVAWLLRLE